MLTLHYYPGNASLAPHMVLEELGLPYALELVDRTQGAQNSEGYRRLNPTGLIPTLVDGDQPIFETAAILLHLADMAPEKGLMPPVGTRDRALAYQWLIHLTNTVQPAYITYYYPDRYSTDPAHAPAVKAAAERRLDGMFDLLERALAGKDYLLGDDVCVADHMLLMMVRWGRNFAGRPPRTLPNLGAHAARMADRPAVRRAFEREGLAAPWY